jgi:hypothetical protein
MYPPWEKELVQTVPAGHPVTGSFSVGLPSFAPPGAYKIELEVRDKVKTASVQSAPDFQVDAPSTPPAPRLEMREFTLSLAGRCSSPFHNAGARA